MDKALSKARQRLAVTFEIRQRIAATEPGVCQIWVDRQGFFIRKKCLIRAAQVRQGISAVHMSIGKPRVDCQSAIAAVERLSIPLQLTQNIGQIIVAIAEMAFTSMSFLHEDNAVL